MILYFNPGQSCTRPPRNNTTPCSWRLAFSPGMYAVIKRPSFNRRTAHFRCAEFGFRGVRTTFFTQTPLRCGPRRMRRLAGITGFARFRFVRGFWRRTWFSVGKNLFAWTVIGDWLYNDWFTSSVEFDGKEDVIKLLCLTDWWEMERRTKLEHMLCWKVRTTTDACTQLRKIADTDILC